MLTSLKAYSLLLRMMHLKGSTWKDALEIGKWILEYDKRWSLLSDFKTLVGNTVKENQSWIVKWLKKNRSYSGLSKGGNKPQYRTGLNFEYTKKWGVIAKETDGDPWMKNDKEAFLCWGALAEGRPE